MSEKPIVFSGNMIRAILDGSKTQTRRVIKFPKHADPSEILSMHPDSGGTWIGWSTTEPHLARLTKKYYCGQGIPCPYGKPGERLWVRETWTMHENDKGAECSLYKADVPDPELYGPWRSPIHMPRNLCRITLKITSVRAERLQSISEHDCCLELGALVEWPGLGPEPYKRDVRSSFAFAWNIINAKRGYAWNTNPWVWAIEFKKL